MFYQHVADELNIGDGPPPRTMRIFDPLPGDIQEQARWGRLLSDPDWGAPVPPSTIPRRILYIDIDIDIANDRERSFPGRGKSTTYGS
jgi:hypothetical protein